MKNLNWKPLRKIVAAGLSGVTASGVVTFLSESNIAEVPVGVGTFIAAGAAVAAGYLIPERRTR